VFSFRTTTLSLKLVKSRSSFTSRPSPMEWSLIFLCLHQGPLRWNGHWFSYVYIKALYDGMVIDFLMFTSRPSPMECSLIFLCLHQGPLQWNGHWFLCHIKALSNRMVVDFCHIKTLSYGMVESCFYFPYHDPLHRIGHRTRLSRFLFIHFLLKIQTKLVSLSLLIFNYDNLEMSHFHII